MVLRRLRSMFGGTPPATEEPSPLYGLDEEERGRIGTQEDPLRNFEAAMQRNEEAERAERNGDPERAIQLYETSIAEEFVGSHPYERLASLYERRRNPAEALRVYEAVLKLAASGKMPRGAQRSADRKLPEFEVRIERYRRLLDEER
jgi:tetratricopeptide (TPR) repeat protein